MTQRGRSPDGEVNEMPYRAMIKQSSKDRAKRRPDLRRSLDPRMRALLEQLDEIPYERVVPTSSDAEDVLDASLARINSASS